MYQNTIEATEKNNESLFLVYENARLNLAYINITSKLKASPRQLRSKLGFFRIVGGGVSMTHVYVSNGISKNSGAFFHVSRSSTIDIKNTTTFPEMWVN